MTRTYLLAGVASLAAACAADSGAMVILTNQVPGDGCVVQASTTGTFRGRGLLHPEAQFGYVFTPVIQSRVEESDRAQRLIFLEGAEIKLDRIDGAPTEIDSFSTLFSGSIEPGGSIGVPFEITRPGMPEGNYVAHVQAYGTLEGGDVESQVFDYPIRVSADDFEVVLGDCAALETGYEGVLTGGACNPLQDGSIECCLEGDTKICPAAGPTAEAP